MADFASRFTVLFEAPFWIGLYERESKGKYEVCKITFGAQPKDCEVYEFFLKNFCKLRFVKSKSPDKTCDGRINPKRMQRIIKKQIIKNPAVGTKAMQALKLEHEQNKVLRKHISREKREAASELKYNIHATKKKEKHKGH